MMHIPATTEANQPISLDGALLSPEKYHVCICVVIVIRCRDIVKTATATKRSVKSASLPNEVCPDEGFASACNDVLVACRKTARDKSHETFDMMMTTVQRVPS